MQAAASGFQAPASGFREPAGGRPISHPELLFVRHDIWLRTLNPDAQRLTPEALAPDAFFTSPRALLALDWLLMTRTEQNRIERRSSQRFSYQVPVLLRVPADGRSGTGCTQDLSSRGALVWTALQLKEATPVEMV